MDSLFSDRISDVPRSFIREILKDALDPGTISFAGGLPNRDFFPEKELREASTKVFDQQGKDVFQYSNSEGYEPLKQQIAERYAAKGLDVPVENILITSGSQQGLDLLGKIAINEGEGLVIEEPGYLGAIQAFAIYRPNFIPVPVSEQGIDCNKLREVFATKAPKLMYTVPNFQNPSGITYPEDNRREVATIIDGTSTILIEDNPYGDLRFSGQEASSFYELIPNNTIMLGSFSKIVVPGFRLGWIVAPPAIMQKLLIAKQAADLHTNQFAQCVVHQYLKDNDINAHIQKIIEAYGLQKQAMVTAIQRHFPTEVSHTNPEGGMFLWATLPEGMSAMKLFELAAKDRVVFVPGDPFYVSKNNVNTMRLNFSCVDENTIETGIERLGQAIRSLM
jgi:2-aminoadipate transaminase